ncbi:MAG: SRPBCC family protein [Deltaproteobacteria bacterium]|jgi:carbon monoxide dehydrogenase subunit G|nr:SRPBCC family protein [Deltaproteobacteria bacterium]MBW2499003.1 SRPBCC family protein [Deltaproteobacteria bacterium]
MAEHTYTVTSSAAPESVWGFVSDMDKWAPFLLGYQSHEKQSDRESVWKIKGDVGSLSRIVDFRVQITEWDEPEHVSFTLEGIGEPMRGDGSFDLEALDPDEAAALAPRPEERRVGFFVRLWAALVRRLLGRRSAAPEARGETGPAAVRLTFRLNVTPMGAMAPMLDAMIKPVMVATAEDLAQRIVAHLEHR